MKCLVFYNPSELFGFAHNISLIKVSIYLYYYSSITTHVAVYRKEEGLIKFQARYFILVKSRQFSLYKYYFDWYPLKAVDTFGKLLKIIISIKPYLLTSNGELFVV